MKNIKAGLTAYWSERQYSRSFAFYNFIAYGISLAKKRVYGARKDIFFTYIAMLIIV